MVGSFKKRRLGPRRESDRGLASVDVHHPRWLAVGLLILLMSVADAVLTLTLMHVGATEANPLMDPLVQGSGYSFAAWKFGLTSLGIVLLTIMARLSAFGRLPVSTILYVVLGLYLTLVGYELWLLERLTGHVFAGFV
jgi:hypothetical protein